MTMKRKTILSVTAVVALCLLGAWAVRTQERRPQDVTLTQPDRPESGFGTDFRLPDSLAARWSEWPERPERMGPEEAASEDMTVRPAVPMTSVIVVQREHLPVNTMVLNNNTLRIGRYVILSNGQAENWGGYPAGYQDARTISLPIP